MLVLLTHTANLVAIGALAGFGKELVMVSRQSGLNGKSMAIGLYKGFGNELTIALH